jgi:hypothetical protein
VGNKGQIIGKIMTIQKATEALNKAVTENKYGKYSNIFLQF